VEFVGFVLPVGMGYLAAMPRARFRPTAPTSAPGRRLPGLPPSGAGAASAPTRPLPGARVPARLLRLGALVAAAALGAACEPAGESRSEEESVPVAPSRGEATAGGSASRDSAGGPGDGSAAPDDARAAEAWPASFLVRPSENATTLHLGPRDGAPPIGFVYPGATVVPKAGAAAGRLFVEVGGSLRARGWMDIDRLAVRAQRTCRLGGTPVYLGPNDLVQVVGLDERGLLEVRAEPSLGPEGQAPALPAFEGVCPPDRFAAARAGGGAEGPSPGQPFRLPAGRPVDLYDQPGGEVVARLPATTPPLVAVVLRDQGQWKGVRVGLGPYLVGFVSVPLSPADQAPSPAPRDLPAPGGSDGVPAVIADGNVDRPLWRVRPGTRVTFDENVIGELSAAGYAREMNRFDSGTVDVFVAADGSSAVRGMVPADALEAVPSASQPGGGLGARGTGARGAGARGTGGGTTTGSTTTTPTTGEGGSTGDADAPYVPGGLDD